VRRDSSLRCGTSLLSRGTICVDLEVAPVAKRDAPNRFRANGTPQPCQRPRPHSGLRWSHESAQNAASRILVRFLSLGRTLKPRFNCVPLARSTVPRGPRSFSASPSCGFAQVRQARLFGAASSGKRFLSQTEFRATARPTVPRFGQGGLSSGSIQVRQTRPFASFSAAAASMPSRQKCDRNLARIAK
jgi:hypothetical protein